ncbi:MAG: glyoxylate reductase [Chloroflexota bacterium]|nr:glyoxylate reductase [Chloroflexota bacterium]
MSRAQPSTRSRVFVARHIPAVGLDLLAGSCEVDLWDGLLSPPREALLTRVAGCAGILSLLTDRIDAAIMDAAGPGLKVISNYAAGVDNVDLPAATARRVPVGHTPDVLTETTADLAWALLMAAARRLAEGVRYVERGEWRTWEPELLLGHDMHGATLGVVGLGRIGRAVARRAGGFSMRVLASGSGHAPSEPPPDAVELVELPTLLRESDFISLHAPLTPETRGLFGAEVFAAMKRTAILVNTARGPLVDTGALVDALHNGEIGGAALDVTDPEPLPADHPLLTLANCIVVPHIGSASVATRSRMAEMAAQNLLAGLRGERLPHCANREVYG